MTGPNTSGGSTGAPATGTAATGTGAAMGAQGGTAGQRQQPPRPYGHGSRSTDIAAVIGAHAGENKARAARAGADVRTVSSTVEGEPATIHNESIAQMRERVRREREAAEPTEFQASLVGRQPGEPAPGAVDTLAASGVRGATGADVGAGAGGGPGAGAGGVGGVTASSLAPAGGAASGTAGAGTTGTGGTAAAR